MSMNLNLTADLITRGPRSGIVWKYLQILEGRYEGMQGRRQKERFRNHEDMILSMREGLIERMSQKKTVDEDQQKISSFNRLLIVFS